MVMASARQRPNVSCFDSGRPRGKAPLDKTHKYALRSRSKTGYCVPDIERGLNEGKRTSEKDEACSNHQARKIRAVNLQTARLNAVFNVSSLTNTSPQFHRLFMTGGPGLGYSASLDPASDESKFGKKTIAAFIK